MADEEDLIVTISGPALSMLLYENARVHDQIGFFLGEVAVYMTKQVTDSDRDVETVRQHINIKNIVSYPISAPFHNSIGQIDKEKLELFLSDSVNKVVGWYHYKENHRLVASFRDGILHQELSKYFSENNKLVSEENFIFCILTTSLSNNNGTHKFKQLFRHKKNDVFNSVTLKINNLGADASRPDGSDYKPAPQLSSCPTDTFHKVYDAIKYKLKETSGVESVTLIQKAAEHMLIKLIPEVTTSDRMVSELEHKLRHLRNEHFRRLYEATSELSDKMNKMDVDDAKTEETSETKCPSSPEMYSPPKHQGDSKTPQKKSNKLEESDDSMNQSITEKGEKEEQSSPQEALETPRSPTFAATRSIKKIRSDQNARTISIGRGSTLHPRQPTCDQEPGRS